MATLQLATEELELLLTINAIMEFDKENPGNIPEGGIGEIVVSNALMSAEEFDKVAKDLNQFGLLDDEWMLTEAAVNYIKQFESDIENLKKSKEAVCKNDYRKVDFVKLKEKFSFVKEKVKGINFETVYMWVSLAAALVQIGQAFI